MIRIKINKNEEKYKILVIIALLSVSVFLTYYFHVLLKISIIYTHFFYVPIILACLWWKRKGLIVPIFLAILLIFFPIFLGLNFLRIDDFLRVFILLSIGIIISILSEQTSKSEQELEESEEKYRNIINNTKEVIIILKIDGEISFVSPQFFTLLGINKGKNLEIKDIQSLSKFIHPDDFNNLIFLIKRGTKQKAVVYDQDVEFRALHKEGHYIWLSASSKNYYDENGNVIGFISVLRDATTRKKAEQKLKESEENLRVLNIELEQKVLVRTKELSESEKKYREAYNRAEFYKDIFTHDINNILQSILSGILLSEMSIDNPEKLEELKTNYELIKKQIKRGAKLVSNIRKLSKLEETEILIKKIEIYNILEKSITYVKNTYQDRNLNIQVDSIGEKLYIHANELIEDVFENIFINAVKYNENPKVEIIVRISREQKKGGNYLKMEFIDNSIGIEATRKNLIFKRGVSKDISIQGMGIGLSLVKKIIETYNGKIWVEDRVKGDHSKGSNFVLLIPEVI